MKRPHDQWRMRDHVAFFSYRWLALALVAMALALPGRPAGTLARDAGLLLLLGLISIAATAVAQGYVRIVRQRPALLGLDLMASIIVIWLSGSGFFPFLPYALGALVLPALVFGWRGAMLAAALFTALDLFGLTTLNAHVGTALSAGALGVRTVFPIAFACAWAIAGRLLPRERTATSHQSPSIAAIRPDGMGADANSPGRQSPTVRVTSLSRNDASQVARPGNLAATTPLLLARASAEQQPEHSRRVLYALPFSPDVSLAAALEQLATLATRRSGLEVRATSIGDVRPLNAVQQLVLLRCAQEALLNVQQHARASSARLTLSYEPRAVTLTVQDDGVGLLDGTYERPGVHALRAVRYRLAELDGQLAVFDGENGGLTLRASIPLE